MIWGLLLRSILKATGKIATNKSMRLIGAKFVDDIVKSQKMRLIGSTGSFPKYKRYYDRYKQFKDDSGFGEDKRFRNKKEFLFYEGTRKNDFLRKTYTIYLNERKKDYDKQQLRKDYNELTTKIEQDAIRMFKQGKGIDRSDFKTFMNWYRKQKLGSQQAYKELFSEEIEVVFKSSWILFGLFIPYGRKKDRGIMCLQLYNSKSKRNPSLFYQWIRVEREVWEIITKTPTGENFWKEWYAANRTNKKYLTMDSIYYNNNSNKESK